jgi:hypothetical protein
MFGLPDLDRSLFCTDLDPDRSRNKQRSKKNHDVYYFVASFCIWSMKADIKVPSKSNKKKTLKKKLIFGWHLVSH